MKRVKAMLVTAVALVALVLAACDDAEHGEDSDSTQSIESKSSSTSTDTSQDSTSQDKDNSVVKDNVILSYRYTNFAWGIIDFCIIECIERQDKTPLLIQAVFSIGGVMCSALRNVMFIP